MAVKVTVRSGDDLLYVWVNQPENEQARRDAGYYMDAAEHGEAPGRWFGPGAEALGLPPGSRVVKAEYLAVYKQIHPQTGEKIGSKPGDYGKFADAYERKLAAEPQATEARKTELRAEAHKESRIAYPYTDLTVSFSKDISVFGAGIRAQLRHAKDTQDTRAQTYWQTQLDTFQECLQTGNRAGLEYAQRWAGVTRTGHHGTQVDGREPGKYEPAGFIVSSWLQGTSRAGDPQEHVHNQFARMMITDKDGKARAKSGAALRAAIPGMAGITAVATEAALAQAFDLEFRARADGLGNGIVGISRGLQELYSSRTVTIDAQMPEAIERHRTRTGADPTQAQLYNIRQQVTLASRDSKSDGNIDWDAHAQEWDARSAGELARIPARVSNLNGPDGDTHARNTRSPAGPPDRSALTQACRDALELTQAGSAAWTRAELLKSLSITMPPQRGMAPEAAVRLVERQADEILASVHGDVVSLEAPEFLTYPESMRRDPDRRTVYERPGQTRYATRPHLDKEHALISHAQRLGGWHMESERCAELLGASVEDLERALITQSAEASETRTTTGLRMDQAAAVYHALTNRRTATILCGPAGAGKSFSLGAAASVALAGGAGRVYGVACSQTATNVLRDAAEAAGADITAVNSAQLLGLRRPGDLRPPVPMTLEPGSLVMIDEASMLPLDHTLAIMRMATASGCKVVPAGDQEQLAAVEGGGAMTLLAARLGYVKLAEPVRFESQWERDASLRLRAGDDTVLEEYDRQGRFRSGSIDNVLEQGAKLYVSNTLRGIHTRLIAIDWERCRELSRRVRGDLMHLGIVSDGPAINLAEGAEASAGDLIVCRENDHDVAMANGDVFRVESVDGDSADLRMVIGRNPDGSAAFSDNTVTYSKFGKMNLAYAMTGHSAQGDTVTAGIAVITGREARNWLYVAMTRGARTNHAIVVDESESADPDPRAPAAPELARAERLKAERSGTPVKGKVSESDRHYIGMLADVLSRDGTSDSATEIQRRNLANADHLGILHQIWQTETLEAQTANYRAIVRELLPPDLEDYAESPTSQWLYRTFRQAELCGQDPRRLMAKAVMAGKLESSRDLASVLNHRISGYIAGMVPVARSWSDQVPEVSDPELAQFLNELAGMMDGRKDRLGEFAAEAQPTWITGAIGPVPDDPTDRLSWESKAASIYAYREIYNFAREDEAIGPEPTVTSPEKHASWTQAHMAMGSPGADDLSGLSDPQLRARRSAFTGATSWAPRYPHAELQQVRLGLYEAEQNKIRLEAEATVARERGEIDKADRHERLARSHDVLAARYRDAQPDLVAATEDYDNWLQQTEPTRRVATAADAELRRRYPDDRLPELVSAEPGPVTEAEHEELATVDLDAEYERPAWLTQMADDSRRYREARAERESQVVPAEDDEAEPEGYAWRSLLARDRDAVLQPAPDEIKAAQPVLDAQRAAEGREATS